MAGLRDVLGGVYRRDDPTEGENEATMLEEPPVDDDVVAESAVPDWGFDDDEVPDIPEVVDVDASSLVPGAEIDWEAATAAEPDLGDGLSVDDEGPTTPKVFDLDDPDHGAPAWDVPDDEVKSVVTSAFADLDLLDDEPTVGWDAETAGTVADASTFDEPESVELIESARSEPVAVGADPWIRADDDIVPPSGKRRGLFRRG